MRNLARHLVLRTALFLFLTAQGFSQDRTPMQRGNKPPLDKEQAVERLQQFRNQRLSRDFIFQFELEHLPRRGDPTLYNGLLWGTWGEQGPLVRARFATEPEAFHGPSLEVLLHNGVQPKAWFRLLKSDAADQNGQLPKFVELPPNHWYRELLPGVGYTAFDLLMPFTYWEDTRYIKPDKVKGRPAQVYQAFPPKNFPGAGIKFSSVEYILDDSYNALLRVQLMDKEGKATQTFKIQDFKKVEDGEWIVKTIDLLDEKTRDKARFRVVAASLHDALPPLIFDSENPSVPQPAQLQRF
jgi:hypothetical protein